MSDFRSVSEPSPARGARPAAAHLFDNRLIGFLRCDASGTVLTANRVFADWVGYSNPAVLAGLSVESFLVEPDLFGEWLARPAPSVLAFDLRRRDGESRAVKAEMHTRQGDSLPNVELYVVEDAEARLMPRIASLEAALTLTSGTLHDINNVLTVLGGNLFLLTENLRGHDEVYEQARRARNAATRGGNLLRELLSFNRGRERNSKAMSPANHVTALAPLLERAVGSGNELRIAADDGNGSVQASAAQFESVLINLVKNACDALADKGRIIIGVRDEKLGPRDAQALRVPAGEYVCVSVTDNGCGIAEKDLQHVTEPRFTTKTRRHGSGLGLAMVQRFVQQCQGGLRVDSKEGIGTSVRLWLPKTERLAETTANMTVPLSTLPGGDEQILLVARDPEFRSAVQDILKTLGYTLSVAGSMEEALDIIAGAAPPQLLVCERSADAERAERQLVAALRRTDRDIRHVALLPAGADTEQIAPDADAHICRPINVPELARAVRYVLEER